MDYPCLAKPAPFAAPALRRPLRGDHDDRPHPQSRVRRGARLGDIAPSNPRIWAGREPRVAIVGAGFGGLSAAMALRRAPVQVTVIDRRNHHLFQPLLYQVATAGLSPADIAQPIRSILRHQRNATVLLGRVTGVDRAAREVLIGSRRGPTTI